ncbi:MAG: hypothetical protein PHG91_04765 [Syntrophales bacterium]|jgi:hypothetical protein|nr:hypothetical protein [Syntrophales bacterium]MDD5232688.1 hypothetical protein [Syntrophales bacterium]MDD5533734.1 hypothetical protein [Syntrophales bacterium]HPL63215.1 hypothetical protein [Syntrophales bacterium]
MKKAERDLLLGIAEELILQLRTKMQEIESLSPKGSALSIATFRERLWYLEDMVEKIRADSGGGDTFSP